MFYFELLRLSKLIAVFWILKRFERKILLWRSIYLHVAKYCEDPHQLCEVYLHFNIVVLHYE